MGYKYLNTIGLTKINIHIDMSHLFDIIYHRTLAFLDVP